MVWLPWCPWLSTARCPSPPPNPGVELFLGMAMEGSTKKFGAVLLRGRSPIGASVVDSAPRFEKEDRTGVTCAGGEFV